MRINFRPIVVLFLSIQCALASYDSEEEHFQSTSSHHDITYDSKNNKYKWIPNSKTLGFVLSTPACVDKNDKLIVRKFENNAWIPEKVECVKEAMCTKKEFLWEGQVFPIYYGYCSKYNRFQSQHDLCDKLNGTTAGQPNMCYTALASGSTVDLGQYLEAITANVSIKVPKHDLLQLGTTGVPFFPKNESFYIQNIDGHVEFSQSLYDPRIPYLRSFKIAPVKVSLSLKYSPNNGSLVLHCYNCDYIGSMSSMEPQKTMSCYTTDDYGHKVKLDLTTFKKVNPRLELFTVKQFQQQSEGFRQYFCEAITIFDAERINTDKILAGYQEPSTLSLAFFMNSSSTFLRNRKEFLNQFKNDFEVRSARIVKIDEFGKILMHALVPSSTYTIESFTETLSEKYGKNFYGTVNSTDYCYSEPFASSSWRTVRKGQTSFLRDFRIRNKKGVPMTRKCVGNFEYGAKWEQIKEEPVIKEVDFKTQKWMGIVTEMNETNVNENVLGLNKDVCHSAWKMESTSVVVMADVFDKLKFHKKTIAQDNVESLSEYYEDSTYDDDNNEYLWIPKNFTKDVVLSTPACLGENGLLVVRLFLENEWIPGKGGRCMKKAVCTKQKLLWDEQIYSIYNDYCSQLNRFQSEKGLCERLNGTTSNQSNMCLTITMKGSALGVGEYLINKEAIRVLLKDVDFDELRLNTTGISGSSPLEVLVRKEIIDQTTPINQSSPFLRIFEIPRVRVSMDLKYFQEDRSLSLYCRNCDHIGVIGSEKIMGCFTTNDYGDRVRIELTATGFNTFTLEQFAPTEEGFRQYYCEGITIFDAEIITSNIVLVGFQEPSTLSLAFFMSSKGFLENSTDFIIQLKKDIKAKSVRVVKIYELGQILLHALVSNSTYTIKSFTETLSEKYGKNFYGTVNSTDYCYSEPFASSSWRTVKIGQTSFLKDFKIRNKKGIPMARKCVGNFEYGAKWEEIREEPVIEEVDVKAQKWIDIIKEVNETNVNENVVKLNRDVGNSSWKMEPTSVVVMADVFDKLNLHKKNIASDNVESLSETCSKLMEQPRETFEQLIETNQTNVLLSSIEDIFDEAFTREDMVTNERGVSFTVHEQFSVFSIDPQKSNVRGIGFYTKAGKNRLKEGSIHFEYITTTQNLESFKSQDDPDLNIATYFPEDLLSYLNPTKNKNFRIIFKIFKNDNFFQTLNDTTPDQSVEGEVISISVPGYSKEFLDLFLPIVFRIKGGHPGCYYWNYNTWVKGGIGSFLTNSNFLYCQVNHITPFTRITDVVNFTSVNTFEYKALDILTQIGLSLSLLGVIGILVSTYYIPELRFSKSSKILLQITIALLFEIILFFISGSSGIQKRGGLCMITGSLLQYTILVKFVWMTMTSVNNWLRWYSPFKYGMRRDSNENQISTSMFLVGWGAPIPLVTTCVILQSEPAELDICFPSGNVKVWGFLVPMYFMFAVIVIFFVLLILEFKKMVDSNIRRNNKQVIRQIIRNIRLLIFSMGIPWFLGALHMIFSGGIFSYLFCILVPLQGFFMFLFLVGLNPKVQKEVRNKISKKQIPTKDEDRTSSLPITSVTNNGERSTMS